METVSIQKSFVKQLSISM